MNDDEALKQWDATIRTAKQPDNTVDMSTPPTVSRTRKNDANIIPDSNLALASDLHADRADLQDIDDQASDQGNDVNQVTRQPGADYLSQAVRSPDFSFAATDTVKLARGYTAYKLLSEDAQYDNDGNVIEPMTIVLLHGLLESSYIWEDVAEVLSTDDTGPRARVLAFDFYGHGRFYICYITSMC